MSPSWSVEGCWSWTSRPSAASDSGSTSQALDDFEADYGQRQDQCKEDKRPVLETLTAGKLDTI